MNKLLIKTLQAELESLKKNLQDKLEELANPKSNPALDGKTDVDILCNISEKVNIINRRKEYIEFAIYHVSSEREELSFSDAAFLMLRGVDSTDDFEALGYKKGIIGKVLRSMEAGRG